MSEEDLRRSDFEQARDSMNSLPASKQAKSIHVFASDFLPFAGCARTAGGNRSMQIISALQNAGHQVTYSMPLDNFIAKKSLATVLPQLSKEELWACEHFAEPEVVLNRIQPDVAIFCTMNSFKQVARYAKDIVQIVDLNGPVHFEAHLLEADSYDSGAQDAVLMESRCRYVVEQLRNVDYVLTVSERQKYFWSAYCSLAGFSLDDLNVLVCPAAYEVAPVARKTEPTPSIVYAGGFYPWQRPDRFLIAAASFLEGVEGAIFHIFGAPHTGVPNEAASKQLIRELEQFSCVRYHGYKPIEELLEVCSSAWCALELMEQNIERELAITGRTVVFLSAGTPVIYNDFSSLSELIRKYQAGWTVSPDNISGLEATLKELLVGGPKLVDELSQNAYRLAASEFNSENAMAPLVELCNRDLRKRRSAAARRRAQINTSSRNSVGRVLAISPDHGPLRDSRIGNPLRALQRQGLIDSWKATDLLFSGLQADSTRYDAIIVHRAIPPFIYQIFKNLSLPFAQDIDDNLLARASYRRHEKLELDILTGLAFCSVLTVPNPRLVRVLEKYSCLPLASKAFVTPNSLPFPSSRASKPASRPSQIFWIQSDIAALDQSREVVEAAVDEFSRRHGLPIVLIGRKVLDNPQFANQIALGEIDFTSLLQWLEFQPTGIGIAPLETHADPETRDFVSGKSDLKMLLFSGYGHPGVYSAAPPYADSPLKDRLRVIENSKQQWADALEDQFEEGWRTASEVAAEIQAKRNADRVARESWAPALEACVLSKPVLGHELFEAYLASAEVNRGAASNIGYLLANRDVLDYCLADENAVGHTHFSQFGFAEDRRVLHSRQASEELLNQLDEESARLAAVVLEKMKQPQQNSELLEAENESAKLRAILSGVLTSRSWRLTAPLRTLAQKTRR